MFEIAFKFLSTKFRVEPDFLRFASPVSLHISKAFAFSSCGLQDSFCQVSCIEAQILLYGFNDGNQKFTCLNFRSVGLFYFGQNITIMKSNAKSPEEYIKELEGVQREQVEILRKCVLENLPEGFEEGMGYGMLAYVVPHTKYPAGYHCDPKLPLPFINIAAQKRHTALYHSGLYSDNELSKWFVEEFTKRTGKKPDLGKSCLRFKLKDEIPEDLIGALCRKINPEQWIKIYESHIKR